MRDRIERFGVTSSTLLLAVGMALPCGCKGSGRAAAQATASARPAATAVDSPKAAMPLEQITPPVAKPVRPSELAALSERSTKQLSKARSLAAEQRFAEATLELDRAQRYDPGHPEIESALATLHWQSGNAERARAHASRAIEGNPDLAAAHYIVGRDSFASGDRSAAIREFRIALLCSDADVLLDVTAATRLQLAVALEQEEYLSAALLQYEAFEAALKQLASSENNAATAAALRTEAGSIPDARSRILEKLGRYAEAAAALEPGVRSAPGDVALGARYARLLGRGGDWEAALNAARGIRSDDGVVIDLLFELHRAAGHPDRVVDDLRAMMRDRPASSRLALSLADVLLRLQKPDEAVDALQSYLADHDEDDVVRLRLVGLLIDRSRWQEALQTAAVAIKRGTPRAADFEAKIVGLSGNAAAVDELLKGPSSLGADPATDYLRGCLAEAAGQSEDAERLLRRGVDAGASSPRARAALGELYLNKYRYDDAKAVLGAGDAEATDAAVAMVLGRVYERLDDLESAERQFRAVTQMDRTNTRAMLELAKIYRRSDRSNLAQRQLRVLLEQEPSHEGAREMLAISHFSEGKPDAGFQQIEELKRLTKRPTTLARCEVLLSPELRRDAEARRRTLKDAIAKSSPDAVTWIAIAETYEENEPDEQRKAYAEALRADPDSEEAMLGLVDADRRRLAYEDSAKRMEELIQRRPNRNRWRLELADNYITLQQFDRALEIAKEVEARSDLERPLRRGSRLAILESLRAADRRDDALRQLEAWVEAQPDDPEWSRWLADEYLEQHKADRAVELYRRLSGTEGNDWAAIAGLTDALAKAGRMEQAYQALLDRLEQDRESDAGIYTMCSLMTDAGQLDDAIELVRNHLLRTTNRQAFQDFMAAHLREAKRAGEAVHYLEALMDEVVALLRAAGDGRRPVRPANRPVSNLANWPNDTDSAEALHDRLIELRLGIGQTLILDKRAREAEQRITEWLDSSPEPAVRAQFLWLLALAQRAQKDEDRANETLRRAILLMPTNVGLNNDVAYGFIERGERLDEAERMIRFALSRSPRQAAYLDTYGWLLYKKGQFAEAKEWLVRASRSTSGKDPVLLDHLGDACWRLNEKDSALGHWQESLSRMNERKEEEINSADERRALVQVPKKIEDAKAGREPDVAPLGRP